MISNRNKRVTRGYGLCEGLLSQLRSNKANSLIRPGLRKGKILDIGCGNYPNFLLNTDFAEKYGIDQLVTDDYQVQWKESGMKFQYFDLEKQNGLPFQDQFFDVVTMLAVFEHITPEKLVKHLQDIRRILKPGGQFVMTTPAARSEGLLNLMGRLRLISACELDEHKAAYHVKTIISILEQGGFSRGSITSGYFECYLNIWVVVDN